MNVGSHFLYTGFFLLFIQLSASGQQNEAFEKPRINVAQGLPQSYVSGLVQDRQGLVWIATRDGLARYDGRKFKIFRHRPGDTASLSSNVIVSIFLDNRLQLWIQYEPGYIDILNTETGGIFHFTNDSVYKQVFLRVKNNDAIAQDSENNYWLLGERGGIFIVNMQRHQLHFYNNMQLGLAHNPITGIAVIDSNVALVADTAIVFMKAGGRIKGLVPYTFSFPHLFNATRRWKDNSPIVRKDGSLVIIDESRVVIFQPSTKVFTVKPLTGMQMYVHPTHVQDNKGNIIFSFVGVIYKLTPANELSVWRTDSLANSEAISAMMFDASGVLWVGITGYGLRQFDVRLPRMSSQLYQKDFKYDILKNYLHAAEKDIDSSPLKGLDPYLFRWAKDNNGKIWMAKSGADYTPYPNICYYQSGRVITGKWHYNDTATASHVRINALAVSSAGQLWGVDYYLRLLRFDTLTQTVTVLNQVPVPGISELHEINSLVMDGEDMFWISTTFGLVRYDLKTNTSFLYRDIVPGSTLTILTNDPANSNIMWIGSVGGGIIKFNKKTYKYNIYTTYDGLPNNTVYAILPANNKFWCSSNKGIFSFDPQSHAVRSYTTLDGLPVDEFNRFHFLSLPGGQLAFGATAGYTVFDPEIIAGDTFSPAVVLTALKINNREANYGNPGSQLTSEVNGLTKLVLSYQENFLSFEFAALEYNIPEKLNYRYMMQGLDNQWVDAGTNNTATYTSLPPGKYWFKVNATNTTGKWSSNIKILQVIITPPFWLTWWFTTAWVIVLGVLLYFFIRLRIASIRKQEQQKNQFDNEVVMLEAQALRAQMNPHFIFNCLNSIKALIQEDKRQQAVIYLTTFSKLIRNQLNNIQQEISLYDEIQTCKLYIQMESLRFGDKITCEFVIEDATDIQSVMVPPLFLQPVIENAIWHGILPMETNGQVTIVIEKKEGFLYCVVEDNGIGRQQSAINKSAKNQTHQSKGVQLIENRLRLYNIKNNVQSSVQVIDKFDMQGNAAGTRVVFKFKLND